MNKKEIINEKYDYIYQIDSSSEDELKELFLVGVNETKKIFNELHKKIKKEDMRLIFEAIGCSQTLSKIEHALALKISKEDFCEFVINTLNNGEIND